MAGRRFLTPESLPAPAGYSHVVEVPASSVVFISGQVPLDPDGALVGAGDIEAQTRQVFSNLTAALAAAGVGWPDVVKLNYFLRDVGQLPTVREVRDQFLDTRRLPASTLVEVSSLFREDVLIEIDAIAMRD
jgi:reactive intermediate/imine deaminase